MNAPDSAGSSSVVTTLALLAGFAATLGAYLTLTLTGHDANELVPTVATLLGIAGLTGHVERRTQQQNAVISKIDKQTNGVLDGRILNGTAAAIADAVANGVLAPGSGTPPPAPAPVARPGRKPAAKRTTAKRTATK